jgi:hypothetical protein
MLAYPRMKRLLAATCAALLPGLALAGDPPANSPGKFAASLERGGEHEECVRLEAGQSRRYYWRANGPVDFNIHFHHGDEVSYPVKREAMRGDGGTFTAKAGEDYCWMWTARDRPVKLEGRIK